MLPENWEAVQAFLRVQTQWDRAGMDGMLTGLDYTRCRDGWALAGIPVTPELFADIQTMEFAALPILQQSDG